MGGGEFGHSFSRKQVKAAYCEREEETLMKRITIMLFGALIVLLIINGSTVVHAQAGDPVQIEKEINIRAAELKLGNPVSPVRRTNPPRGVPELVTWMRDFERGRIYWFPGSFGTIAIRGDILKKFLARGGEAGEFGFPIANETTCSAGSQDVAAQLFQFVIVHLRGPNREITIQPHNGVEVAFGGVPLCGSTSRANPKTETGRFRVILTGFSVERQTDDNVLESDGKGDEVFIVAEVAEYANGEKRPQPPQDPFSALFGNNPLLTLRRTLTSIVMGDANNQEVPRIRAGSAGNNGGLRSGDQFPAKEPWKQVGALSQNRLPMQVWEGELSGQGMVIIVPTIWEWDDGNVRAREQFNQDMNVYFNAGPEYAQRQRLYVREVRASDVFGAGDRPIGVLEEPPTIRLDYYTAVGAAQQSDRHGPGEFEIVYAGNTEKYRLYYKVERLP